MIYIHRAKKQYDGGGRDYDRTVSPGAETIGEAVSYGEAARFIRTLPAGWIYYTSTRPCRNWREKR
jgi:hypothetical protein